MIKYPLNVTIDTNIFEANKFDFGTDSTMSLLVKNVQNGKIKLVLSNIVISEVEKHICRRVDNVCGKARKLRNEYLDILPEQYLTDIGMGIYVQIPDKKTIHQKAKDIFAKFLEDCKVERLDTGSINLEEILEDYFAVRPPFENSEKKKKEFPDAFIAEEIKKRFGGDEIVAIVSQDNGFKKACTNSKNHLFFSSLGELFNTLSKNEEEYIAALELIKNNNDSIIQTIKGMIDDSCVEVHGLSYDQDGIADGYDYDETYLEHCYLSGMRLHIIDDIDEDIITASLWIHGNMAVNCYFKDFDNAPWDSEEKEYVWVEEKHILEKHNVRFACRIELNSKTEEIRVLPFKIVLGGDSRKSRVEINDEQESFYKELEDMDREELGFLPLSQYSDMLENDLNESRMEQTILKLFEQYNEISSSYEELAILYDEICAQVRNKMEEDDAEAFFTALLFEMNIPIDFIEKDTDKLPDKISKWLDGKFDMVSERMERKLPDCIEYGENISILGTNCRAYTLSFDELHGTLEAGSEEQIEVSLLSNKEIIARGYVKLTVGYLDFDEDGGATDGIEDSIDYEVDDVLDALKDLISDLKEELVNEQELANSFANCLK
ncbi:PIN domain-containing protein [Enterocloster clostridioformis]|uniref:PIN domain-containing protein n=1 Tax=Enterocloster clostridioformis TaxID=1531 RepID=UPI001CE09D75|nr:PIN domain-containing protein [Enterocloster clostridioformis]MCA5577318.1 PIN domain-containing protein [Enterocloster clostridioformis]